MKRTITQLTALMMFVCCSLLLTATSSNAFTGNANATANALAPLGVTAVTIPPTCYGSANGSVNITVTGGTSPYTYIWSNGATTEDIANIGGGNYTVTVTDAAGVIKTKPVTVASAINIQGYVTCNKVCYGSCNGTADLTLVNGLAPFTFHWSNNATTEDLSGLCAGVYSVTVKDANGCSKLISTQVQSYTQIVLNTTKVDLNCSGVCIGAIDLSVAGGTAPYSYSWSNGATSEDLSGLCAGSYAVTVTDFNGCQKVKSLSILQPTVLGLTLVPNSIPCFGVCTGAVNATVTGGTAPYTFAWSNGYTNEDLYNVCAGNYSLTVTDAKGCVKVASTTINQTPSPLNISETHTNISCNASCNATIDITVTGGTAPYTYAWSSGATTEDRSGLCQGVYCLTVTDANGCGGTKCIEITQTIPPTVSLTPTHLVCNNMCTGAIDLNVITESAPLTYAWSNGATTEDLSGLCAGEYCVTVTDVNGCTAGDCITITQPTPIVLTPNHTDNPCFGNCMGTASVNADGGNAPYTYAWANGSTENNLSGLCNGEYCVTVYDAHQCSASICISISSPSSLNATANSTNVSCFGYCDGTASVTPTGGTAPYTYIWNNGNINSNMSALCVGEYCVTVYDAHQCSIVKCVSVTQPTVLDATASSTNNSCYNSCNGTASVSAYGGTAPYSYAWSNGNTNANISGLCAGDYCVTVSDAHNCVVVKCVSVSQPSVLEAIATSSNNSCNNSCNGTANVSANGGTAPYSYIWNNGNTNSNISGLCAGQYCVTVYDAHQCSVVKCVSVSQPNVLDATATSTNVLCTSYCNGTANVSANGGTAPYTYAWSNGNTNASASGLCPGQYCVTVYDANQCSVVKCVSVSEPIHLQTYINCSQLNCHGDCNGTADLGVVGGTSPFTYHWSNGASSEDISGLCAGLYCVTVTDANGCTSIACQYVTEPTALSATANSTNNSCFNACNGTANVSATGGTAPYTYIWNNGNTNANISGLCAGQYCVTVYDAHQCSIVKCVSVSQPNELAATTSQSNNNCYQACNGTASVTATGGTAPYTYLWSNGNTNSSVSALCAAQYCVTVKDANQCSIVKCVNITAPTGISATVVGTDATICIAPNCNGSANLTVSGGVAPYTYAWSTGATTEDISGLCAGTYYVTVKDANLCPKTASVVINCAHYCNIGITGYILNIGCNANCNGSINITVSNATSPNYHWSNGATTEDVNGLCAGTYSVTVSDAYLCTASQTFTVNQNTPIVVTTTSANTTNCSGCCNGTASASATGGVAPYTYHWSTGANTANITGLCAGTYSVTVTDASSCTKIASVTIVCTPPCVLTLTGTQINISCNGGNNGSIDLSVSGGTAPYTYHWSNSATTQDLSGLAAGTYSVTVTSAGGCSATKSFTLCQPAAICASVVGYNTCYGVCAGSADLTVSGGTAPYTYIWSNGATTQDLSGLCAGTYSVTVKDANLCSIVKSICITQNSQIVVTITGTNTTNCSGCCNGTASASVSGGTAPYTYHWSTGASCANLTGLCAGTYSLTVTDAAGCTKVGSVTICCVPPCSVTLSATVTNVSCNGGSNGAIDLSVSGTGTFTYHWNSGATTQDRTGLSAGTYSVTVTSSGGCSASASYCVSQPTALCGSICATNTCSGQCTGAADLTVSGGTAPYSYHWNNGATTQDRTCLCAGTYYVTITDAHGCTLAKSVCIVSVSCGCGGKVEDDKSLTLTSTTNTELNMSIYPNPVTAQTTFDFVASQDVSGTLELYSVTGALISEIYRGEMKAGQKYSFSYNADELAAGMYFARLSTNNGSVVMNIMKIQ